MSTRQCNKCLVIRPIAQFAAKRGEGLTSRCLLCRSYDALDPEEMAQRAAQKAQYRKDHPWETWAQKTIHAKRAAGLVVSIAAADLMALLQMRDYRCALTDLPFWTAAKTPQSASWDSPSLDRIVHGGPYSLRNVRIILHCVNTFRGRMPDDQMIRVARALVGTADRWRPTPRAVR